MLTRLTLGLPLVELGEADAGHRSFQIFMRTGVPYGRTASGIFKRLRFHSACSDVCRFVLLSVFDFFYFLCFLNSSSSFLPPRFSSSSSSLFSFFSYSFSTDFAAVEGGSAWRA